jgi:Mg-chelatase subunit ChlI
MAVAAVEKPYNVDCGKSTVGRALADLLPGAVFIYGDDHDASDDASLCTRSQVALQRIETQAAWVDSSACEGSGKCGL